MFLFFVFCGLWFVVLVLVCGFGFGLWFVVCGLGFGLWFVVYPTRPYLSLKRGRSPHAMVRERSGAAGGRGGRSEAVGRRPPVERSRPADRQRSAAGAPCYFEANFHRSLALLQNPEAHIRTGPLAGRGRGGSAPASHDSLSLPHFCTSYSDLSAPVYYYVPAGKAGLFLV